MVERPSRGLRRGQDVFRDGGCDLATQARALIDVSLPVLGIPRL